MRFAHHCLRFLKVNIDFFLIVAASLYPLTWFQPERLYISGDFFLPLTKAPQLDRFHAWVHHIDLGYPSTSLPLQFLWQGFFDLLKLTNIGVIESQKLYFVICFLFSGLGMYYLTSTASVPSIPRFASLLSAIVYMYNPYVMFSFIFLPMYAALPWLFAFWMKSLKKGQVIYALAAGFISPIIFLNFPNPLYPLLAFSVLFLFTIFHIVTEPSKSTLRNIVTSVLVVTLVSAGLNLWWLAPTIDVLPRLFAATMNVPIVEFGKGVSSILDSFRMLGSWNLKAEFGGKLYVPYSDAFQTNPLIIASTFVAPLMAFSAVLLRRRDRLLLFFTLLSIIFLFLAKGSSEPFGSLYSWSLQNIPLFITFRDPYKFMAIVSLSYSFLIGVSCAEIFARIKSRTGFIKVKYVSTKSTTFVILLLASLFLSSWPLVTGDVLVNWYDPSYRGVKIPPFYYEADEWLSNDVDEFRILSLPRTGTYVAYNWGYQGVNVLQQLFKKPVITGAGPIYGQTSGFPSKRMINDLYTMFYKNETDRLGVMFKLLSIKYIIVDESIDTQFYSLPPVSKDTSLLQAQPGTKLVARFGDLLIFQNEFFQPILSGTSQIKVIKGSIDFPGNVGLQDELKEGWTVSSGTLSTYNDGAYINLLSNGSYTYTIAEKSLSIDPIAYPNILVRFKSNPHTSLLLGVRTQNDSVFLEARNPPPMAFENYYTSEEWYTLIYRVTDKIKSQIDSIMIYISNRQDDEYIGKLELWINRIIFAETIGSTEDIITALKNNETELVILKNQNEESSIEYLQRLMTPNHKPRISFRREAGTHVVKVNSSAPFVMVFAESFDAGWKAYIDGKELKWHLVANGYANAWIVDKIGQYEVTISYAPQSLLKQASIISTITLFMVVVLFALHSCIRIKQSEDPNVR